jgi:Uma2 family endonuclease
MSTALPQTRMSVAEYLRFEATASTRHAFERGEVFAMAGGSPAHSRLKFQLVMLLGDQLRHSGCQGFDSDMRIKVEQLELYTYPDAAVTCAQPQFTNESPRSLLNPQVVFEVLSKSTEGYDRGEKFAKYREIPSLRHYVLISQAQRRVDVYTRNDDGSWSFDFAPRGDNVISLSAIGCRLSVDDLYEGIELEPGEQAPQTPLPE